MTTTAQRQQAALEDAVSTVAANLGRPAPPATVGHLAQLLVEAAASEHRDVVAAARTLCVRLGAQELARRRPGQAVELRIPPAAAVQLGDGQAAGPGSGPRHTRGTPPAVVETDPATFVRLLAGDLSYADARDTHQVSASGAHADLDDLFPLITGE